MWFFSWKTVTGPGSSGQKMASLIPGQDWFHCFNPNIDFDNLVVHFEERFIRANGQSLTEPLSD